VGQRHGGVTGQPIHFMPKGVKVDGKHGRTTYSPQKLVNSLAVATLEGRGLGLKKHPALANVTNEDKRLLQRIVGITVEEFNQRLIGKLDTLADKIVDRMLDTVDETPLQTLGFNLAVAIDKRQRIAGLNATQGANVNIQVNNYGSLSKEEIVARLSGKASVPTIQSAPIDLADPNDIDAKVVRKTGAVKE